MASDAGGNKGPSSDRAAGDGAASSDPRSAPVPASQPPPVVTGHQVEVGGRSLRYRATVGALPIRLERGERGTRRERQNPEPPEDQGHQRDQEDHESPDASLFFTAYTLLDERGQAPPTASRPLTFAFNGGPGSSSAWLHLGGLGPRRVAMLPDGAMPPPPFRVDANPQTWLGSTDLVFVDPVGTGWSRARNPELSKSFHEIEGDIAAVAGFVLRYLSRFGRWGSPLFLAAESYGTFRAAGLAGHLIERGVAFNGIVLISSILDLLGAEFHPGNDLPYPLILPTYVAIAWYHGRLPPALQNRALPELLAEVERWALGDYLPALAAGARLGPEERAAVIGRLSSFTGFEGDGTGPAPGFDPSLAAIRPPFTAAVNAYLRGELGWETDEEYHVLRELDWEWGSADAGYPRTAPALAEAFAKNPYLKLFVASGLYDLATPYFATDYTLAHLPLSVEARAAIQVEKYPVGHMVYVEAAGRAKLNADVAGFIERAAAQTAVGLA